MTREEFEAHRRAVADVDRGVGRVLVIASVGLGLAQLVFIFWADRHLDRTPRLSLEGGIFIAYMILVGALVWIYKHRESAARARCPNCGVVLEGMTERVAGATGRCDKCGGQIIDEAAPARQA